VDAREQLRRYLEQRREMGETELVLDTLAVDDALRMLGAMKGGGASASSTASPPNTAPSPSATPSNGGETSDWREALRATGASPAESMKKKVTVPDATHSSGESLAPPARSPSTTPMPMTFVSPIAGIPSGISIGTHGGELFGGSMTSLDSLEAIAAHVATCTRCPLYSTATKPVPGEGNPAADLMCVGEAPGATEDQTGRPFVGAAGQLLTKILAAIELPREQVFICNVLKHRPPGNRNPLPEEVKACSPYLIRQIELVRPKVIVAFGTFAAQTLLETALSLGKLRGQIHRYYGVPLIVTYHPAALLRNPSWKRPTWEDVQLARRILDSTVSGA
jgi:uracil-DNA glycosylase